MEVEKDDYIKYLDQFTTPEGTTFITKEDVEECLANAERFNKSICSVMIDLLLTISGLESTKSLDAIAPKDTAWDRAENKRFEEKMREIDYSFLSRAEDTAILVKVEDITDEDVDDYRRYLKRIKDSCEILKEYTFTNSELDIISRIKCTKEIVENKINMKFQGDGKNKKDKA